MRFLFDTFGIAAGLAAFGAAAVAADLTGDRIPAAAGEILLHPVQHATLVIGYGEEIIYVDPVGGGEKFRDFPVPTLVLVTDIHGDHLHGPTLEAVAPDTTRIVGPGAVIEQLPEGLKSQAIPLDMGKTTVVSGVKLTAVAAYNTTPERLRYHARGRGVGFLVELGGKRLYLSGDTEDIPEMRALKDVDVAFVCMNLPYTMTVEQAADAVRAFRPGIVYPYHYRGSDLARFKALVGDDAGVEVRLRDWYAQ
ncbi:MAG: MBL fold metallo-hydrolase [Verrucomicrobiales bacterium]|nr:MBL fold metallo-hydrolase [Verrucomicrobiales bacterium]